MTLQTLEVWCYPAFVDTSGVDHTFLVCRETEGTLKCWGSADMHYPGRVFVTAAAGDRVYDLADRLRHPFAGYPDTARIGVYAVNGVCHQTTNLYLSLAVGFDGFEMVQDREGSLRPRGYEASKLFYGTHGVFSVGGSLLSHLFYRDWERQIDRASPFESELLDDLQGRALAELSPEQGIAREFAIGAMRRGHNVDAFVHAHAELAAEHTAMLNSDWDTSAPVVGEALANRINDQLVLAQQELAKTMTPAQYEALMGVPPGNWQRVIDPRIASGKA